LGKIGVSPQNSIFIDVAVVADSVLVAKVLLPVDTVVKDLCATIVEWLLPEEFNLTGVLVVVTIVANGCGGLVEGSVFSNIRWGRVTTSTLGIDTGLHERASGVDIRPVNSPAAGVSVNVMDLVELVLLELKLLLRIVGSVITVVLASHSLPTGI